MVRLGEVAVGVQGVLAERLGDLLGGLREIRCGLRLVGQGSEIQLLGDGLGQVGRDELLDHVPLVVHDAVDAEVQVRAVELEKLAQQLLKFVLCSRQ